MRCLVGALDGGEFADCFGEERVVVHAEEVYAAVNCGGECELHRMWYLRDEG